MSMTLQALRRGALAGSRILRLPSCGLTVFPREIFDLADTLEVLDLGANNLAALPDDFARLKQLRVLFCSGTPFTRLPPVLGDCPQLSQIGFRGCGVIEVPSEALPPGLRWLTLTDNAIETLPQALGERPRLQKLMLAGNRLATLPESLSGAASLELLRLAANRFESLPPWLGRLPKLAWLAWAGNPFDRPIAATAVPEVAWGDLTLGALLGEGASGRVHRVVWQSQNLALKLFKGRMTSDGLPEREMAACLAAGAHPHLLGALGRLSGHPEGLDGLLMPLLPDDWRVLAGPPSLESCSRDVYEAELSLDLATACAIARSVGKAAAHLHARGISHGDLYAHNILWDGAGGQAVLSDFGAAAFMPGAQDTLLRRIEVRAWGLLLEELLERCHEAIPARLTDLAGHCTGPDPMQRPELDEALAILGGD